jgi:hypothetical protein
MRSARWPVTGLALGAILGFLWGWLGSNGYEAMDSAVWTGFLGALAGLLAGGIATAVVGRKR